MQPRLRLLCLWLCMLLCATVQAAGFEDTMAQRTLACTACHGLQGRAGPDGFYPRLAGKPAAYLYNQLLNFRTSRRHYPLMAGLLETLDERYLQELADYFSSLSVPYPSPAKAPAVSGPALERARQLVQGGDPALGLPACTQCHGEQLTGVYPATPGLLGLPADYINAQLGGWQTGQRHAMEPDCMAKVARLLSPGDSSAIARWLASQPVPAKAQAAAHKPPASPATQALQCGSDSAAPPATPAAAAATPPADAVARGAYLARIGDCAHCHTAPGDAPYAGGRAIDTPFGAVLSSNITPDPTNGLGQWTADDFWQALHHGVSRDGHLLYPAFPYTSFTRISRADADDLYAFLKTVPASKQPSQSHRLRWPYSAQFALRVWRSLFFTPADAPTQASSPAADAAHGSAWLRGQYLVQGLGHCQECHGARNALGALSQTPQAAGSVLPGALWLAPSLYNPQGASPANWSAAQTVDFLRSGRNSTAIASGPMAEVVLHSTQYLSDADAQAVAQYLRTLPQQSAPSAALVQPPAGMLQKGAKLYEKHCADCHGAEGQGQAGAYPALAGNRQVTQASPNNLINTVLNGGFGPATQGQPRPFGMPPFMLQLKDAEIADVLSYVRNSWGNQAAALSEFDINKFRRKQAP